MAKGKFIVIYGPNNVGKSTQIRLLAKHLLDRGDYLMLLKYPIYHLQPTGPLIDALLRQKQIYLPTTKQNFTEIMSKLLQKKIAPGCEEKEMQKLYAQNRRDFQPSLKQILAAGITVLCEDYVGTGIAWGLTREVKLSYLEKINRNLLTPDLAILLDGQQFQSGIELTHRNEINTKLWQKNRLIHLELAMRYNWPIVEANHSKYYVQSKILNLLAKYDC